MHPATHNANAACVHPSEPQCLLHTGEGHGRRELGLVSSGPGNKEGGGTVCVTSPAMMSLTARVLLPSPVCMHGSSHKRCLVTFNSG